MNTEIKYVYQSPQNFKQEISVIITGVVTPDQILTIMECCADIDQFIPEQVGLPIFGNDRRDDTCWCKLNTYSFSKTDAEPDHDITPEELVNKFLAAKDNWRPEDYCSEEQIEAHTRANTACMTGIVVKDMHGRYYTGQGHGYSAWADQLRFAKIYVSEKMAQRVIVDPRNTAPGLRLVPVEIRELSEPGQAMQKPKNSWHKS